MSSKEKVVECRDVSKFYQVYSAPHDRLKQFLFGRNRKFYREFWALHPISFEVKKGECLGFIGRNGSGKSTLLQILAGTLRPSAGTFDVRGRVAALLELGAGFNPEFSGRENVFLNAAILGLSREQIAERFDKILEFSEIGEFIDQPVKTYSSGMYVRLAFSVAIHVDPDILIVDEALSVGDAAFQYKCMRKIESLQEQGMSILFVTHDTYAVKNLCERAGWLHEGHLIALGDAANVVDQYNDFMREKMAVTQKPDTATAAPVAKAEPSGGEATHGRLLSVDLLDAHGSSAGSFLTGTDMEVRISYEILREVPEGITVGVAVFRNDDLYVCGINTKLDGFSPDASLGKHLLRLKYPSLSLLPGEYYFKMGIFDASGLVRWDFQHSVATFKVSSPYVGDGVALLRHGWE
jgi:ABC-type polysaccharide/polyol phosphate transport system ATPase subunit